MFKLPSFSVCLVSYSVDSDLSLGYTVKGDQSLIRSIQYKLNLIDMNGNQEQFFEIIKIAQDSNQLVGSIYSSSDKTNNLFTFLKNYNKNLEAFFKKLEVFYLLSSHEDASTIYDLNELRTSFHFRLRWLTLMKFIWTFQISMDDTLIYINDEKEFIKLNKSYNNNYRKLLRYIHDYNLFMRGFNLESLKNLKTPSKSSHQVSSNEIQKIYKLSRIKEIVNNFRSSAERFFHYIRTVLTQNNHLFEDFYNDRFVDKSIEFNHIFGFRYVTIKYILNKIVYHYDLEFLVGYLFIKENKRKRVRLAENFYLYKYNSFLKIKLKTLLKKEDKLRLLYPEINFKSFHIYNIYYDELNDLMKYFIDGERIHEKISTEDIVKYFTISFENDSLIHEFLKLLFKEVNLLKEICSKHIYNLEEELRLITLKYKGFLLYEVNDLISDPMNFDHIPIQKFNLYNCYSFLFQARIMKYEARSFALNELLKYFVIAYLKPNVEKLSDNNKSLIKELELLLINQDLPKMPTFQYDRLKLN